MNILDLCWLPLFLSVKLLLITDYGQHLGSHLGLEIALVVIGRGNLRGGRPRRRKCPTPAEDRLTPATLSCIKIYVVNHGRAVHFPRNALLLDRPTRVRNCYILPLFFVTMDVQPALGRAGARIKMHSTRGLVLACAFPVFWKMGVFSDYIGVS